MYSELLVVLLALVACTTGESFADWMTKDFCDRELAVGQVIMNNVVEASDDRFIRVFRGDEELMTGSRYHHSESLTISISNTHDQFVYEALGGAIFEKGGCEGRRVADKPQAILKMPVSGEENVRIVAGWATGHQAVSVTPSFILTPEAWNDRRDDLPDKSKTAAVVEKEKEKNDEQPPKEINDKMAVQDTAKVEKADKIPEPQEDLYAHELHKDEDNHELHDHPHDEGVHPHDPLHLLHRHGPRGVLSIRDELDKLSKSEQKYNTPHVVARDEPQVVKPEEQQDLDHFHLHSKDESHKRIKQGTVDKHLHDIKVRHDHRMEQERGEKERPRDDDVKHPHSFDPRDHDHFDLKHKRIMDSIRDRERYRAREREIFKHDGHEGEEDGEEEGAEEGEEEVDEKEARIAEIMEEEGIHREGKVRKIASKLKRALRGGASYSQYVRSHTVLIGECLLAGTFLVFVGYRLFASRFKIQRYFKKIKGMEEK